MSLREVVAAPETKHWYARRLFATIADRYDLITVVLSYGRDRAWKRRLVRMAQVRPGLRVLDLATGTGDIAHLLHDAGARVVGLDFTERMLQIARSKRAGSAGPLFIAGDMGALPFSDGSFDLITTGYGLRNVPVLTTAIDEMARVLGPHGRVLALDFNRPSNTVVRSAYLVYLFIVGGALGWLLHRDGDTYRYIPASISNYPGADAVTRLFRERGFGQARWFRVLGGLMAIHDARR